MKTAIIIVDDVLYLQKTHEDKSVETVIYSQIGTSRKTGHELVIENFNNGTFPVTYWNQLLAVQNDSRLITVTIHDSPQHPIHGVTGATMNMHRPMQTKTTLAKALESL